MKKRRLGIRARFMLVILTGLVLISVGLDAVIFERTREHMLAARRDQIAALAEAKAREISFRLAAVSHPPQDLGSTLEVLQTQDERRVADLLMSYVAQNSRIYGMAVAYEPRAFRPEQELFGPYVYRSPAGLKTVFLDKSSYNYPRWDWFLMPTLLKKPAWTEPYYDEGGGWILMTTYSAPFFSPQGKVQGVVTADVDLSQLDAEVKSLAKDLQGFGFIVTRQGAFVAAPEPTWVMRESIFSLAEALQRPDLRALGQRMIRGESGVVRIADLLTKKPIWLAFHPIDGPGWSFGVAIPEAAALAPVDQLARFSGFMDAVGLVVFVVVLWFLILGLTSPLKRLAEGARRLAGGDLRFHVTGVKPGDEIGDLADGFNVMVESLNRHIEELTRTTAAKERMESELNLAREIQQSILPRTYPPFPEQPEFDAFAVTIPAREVGGDFYDYFRLGPDRVGLVVADVSGKGVPAALFMTVTRTLIKNAASHHPNPVEALDEVNRQILPDNEMCMFVTVFYAVYQISTGELTFANAGHNPPLLRRASGRVEELPKLGGLAVGVMDEMGLCLGRVNLDHGDVLLAYTDGLTEAVDGQERMYGEERAEKWLAGAGITKAPAMIQNLIADWKGFTGPVEQFDDLTLLLLRRN